ncbi:chloride transporter chloride channel (ClC) family [Klebsiella variicola]|nr:chloride transporter chloride channel (ClC) family [Klebsiella variicola]
MSVAAGNKNNLTRLIAVVLTGILAGLAWPAWCWR